MPVNFVSRRELRAAPKLSSEEDEEKAIASDSRTHSRAAAELWQEYTGKMTT